MLYDLFNRTNLYLSLDLKMGKNLTKRLAILEMYKVKNSL